MSGKKDVIECAFVESTITSSPFFSTPIRLGVNGVEEVLSYGKLSAFEQKGLDAMLPDLKGQVQKGYDFVK